MKLPSEKHVCVAVFAVCIVLNLYFSHQGWDRSLREYNESRQVQTALAARGLQREGWRLDYPYPVFGPPWSAPFEFPAYQQVVARVSSVTGYPLEQSGRAVSLACLYLALPALWLLQAALPIPPSRRLLLLAVLLVSPCYLYYSRTFMIESMAFVCAAWFLVAFARAVPGGSWAWAAAAVLLGSLAGLVKSTTLVVFLAAAGLLTAAMGWRLGRAAGRERWLLWIRAAALVAPSLVVSYVWTRHADAVKAANPLAEIFTSTRLREFIYGTPGEIFTRAFWSRMGDQIWFSTLHPVNAGLLLVGLGISRTTRLVAPPLVLCFFAGPLVFPTLYSRHDYYFYANGVFVLAALAVVWSGLLDWKRLPISLRGSLVGLSLALQFATYWKNYHPIHTLPERPVPELARVLHAVTGPGDVVLAYGEDWNPLLGYFSDRRMVMVVGAAEGEPWRVDEVVGRLGPGQPRALVVTGESRDQPSMISSWTRRLDLNWKPVLVSADTLLLLRHDLALKAKPRLAGIRLKEFTLSEDAPDIESVPRKQITGLADRDHRVAAIFQPAPILLKHPFGFDIITYEGRTALDAHAPTDLCIEVPPGATQAVLEYGIKNSAYNPGTETDGVEFVVALEPLVGPRQILYNMFLNPMEYPAHRAMQKAVVPLPPNAAGRLWFRTLAGPRNSMVSDHAYWTKIEVK